MSDNINFNANRGTYSFVSRREIPWHNLGTIVENALTSAEAIRACNADFEVGLAEVYAKFPRELWKQDAAGNLKRGEKVPGIFATYRKDNLHVFGAVGSRYEVVQNIEAFNFIDNIVATGEAVIETAGVLGNGERIFVTAKLPDYITLSNGDNIESYIFITMAHDGTGQIEAALTKIRIVCNNTLNMALRHCTNKVSFKHTKNVRDRLEAGAKLMRLNNKFSKELNDTLQYLKQQPITDEMVIDVVYKLTLTPDELNLVAMNRGMVQTVSEISTRKKNVITSILNSIAGGPGQELYTGTKLWVYNGITSYLCNTKDYSSNEDKLLSLTSGTEYKLSQKAFDLITNI